MNDNLYDSGATNEKVSDFIAVCHTAFPPPLSKYARITETVGKAQAEALEIVAEAIELRFKAEVGPAGTKLDEAYVEGWRDCRIAIIKALRAWAIIT